MTATEADMQHARDLLHPRDEGKPFAYLDRLKYRDEEYAQIVVVADALAEEREKARAPFRKLATTARVMWDGNYAVRAVSLSDLLSVLDTP